MENMNWDLQALVPLPQAQANPDMGTLLGYDLNFMEGSSAYGPALTGPSSQASSVVSSTGSRGGGQTQGPSPKRRLERKSHTKSRMGCYNCKRRRLKVRVPTATGPHRLTRPVLRGPAIMRPLREEGPPVRVPVLPPDRPPGRTAPRALKYLAGRADPSSRTTRSPCSACRTCGASSTLCCGATRTTPRATRTSGRTRCPVCPGV